MHSKAWQERYPDLALLLQASSIAPQTDVERFAFKAPDVDLLYVYGIHAEVFSQLESWLDAGPKRMLVLLEDELSRLQQFLLTPGAERYLLHPRIHLVGLFWEQSIKKQVEKVVLQFPTDSIAVAALHSNKRKRRFRILSEELHRFSTIVSVLYTELLQYPRLLSNVLPNAYAWTSSFFVHELRDAFRGTPALICGAGPSLDKAAPLLANVSQRALIIACGSAIPALGAKKIVPHLGVAVDPNEEEFARFCASSCFEMPLFYATRLHSDVFSTLCGPKGYMRSATGGPCERILEEEMGLSGSPIGSELGMEAFSVTAFATALAVELGCSPIYFCGVDLAYTGNKRYAMGVVSHPEWKQKDKKGAIRRKDIHGQWIYTHRKWVMESNCIDAFACAHSEVSFANASMQGLGFRHIPNKSLEDLLSFPPCDLHARVHSEIQMASKPPLSKEQLSSVLLRIYEELCHMQHCARLLRTECTMPQPSSGRLALLEHDFAEAKEKIALFSSLDAILSRLQPKERWETWVKLCQESLRAISRTIHTKHHQ